MKRLTEKFKEIGKDMNALTDEEWVKRYGTIPYWGALINAVRERDEEVLGVVTDGVKTFKPRFKRIKQRMEQTL